MLISAISDACPSVGWFSIALPALVLNYFGQGALPLSCRDAIENPFYLLAPGWFHYPLMAFATMATIIASQSIISGVSDPASCPGCACCTPPAAKKDKFMCRR